jgi:hypothetical protein
VARLELPSRREGLPQLQAVGTRVDSRHGCPIEVAVALAEHADTDDTAIPIRIAVRGGFLEPGPNGTLVEPESESHPGAKVIVACPEYKGYDEPDDRPRRGPRPPKEQMDLLDPRNAPERPRVAL